MLRRYSTNQYLNLCYKLHFLTINWSVPGDYQLKAVFEKENMGSHRKFKYYLEIEFHLKKILAVKHLKQDRGVCSMFKI